MTKNLTVVLPVHNVEATLARDVVEVLDVAGDVARGMRLIIVDDGSLDDTFDVANELATRYPQVQVKRHAHRQGLGTALESLRSELAGDFVLVHDGASPIDANQISQMYLEQQTDQQPRPQAQAIEPVTIDDLRLAASTHSAMAAAHSRLAGFQRLMVAPASGSGKRLTRRDRERNPSVGVIPPLPRPNFMGALANFALGE